MKSRAQMRFLLDVVEAAEHYGLSVSSWFRTHSHNELVGGHPKSRHLTWDAFDLVKPAFGLTEEQTRILCEDAFTELRKKGYHGYVRTAGVRHSGDKAVKMFHIHIQRQAPRKS